MERLFKTSHLTFRVVELVENRIDIPAEDFESSHTGVRTSSLKKKVAYHRGFLLDAQE